MGAIISVSELKEQSAFIVVGSFVITRFSIDFLFSKDQSERETAARNMILGACVVEAGKYISALTERATARLS